MYVNTALALIGAGLLFWHVGRLRSARIAVVTAAVLAAVSLAQDAWHVDLGLDGILSIGRSPLGLDASGRMGPNTALCLVFAASAILALLRPSSVGLNLLVGGVLAWAVVGIGVAAFIGHAAGIEGAYAWSDSPSMSLAEAVLLVTVGLLLAAIAAARELSVPDAPVRWLPSHVMLGSFIVSMIFWYALDAREHALSAQVMVARAEEMRVALLSRMRQGLDAFEYMARRWERHGGQSATEWEENATALLDLLPELQAVEWVDAEYSVHWVTPREGNESAVDLSPAFEEQRRTALERSRSTGDVVIAGPLDLVQGGRGLLLLVPLFPGGRFDGFVLAVYSLDRTLEYAVPPDLMGFDARVEFGRPERNREDSGQSPHGVASFRFHDLDGTIVIRARGESHVGHRSALPEVVLAAGCLAGILAGGAVRFGAAARVRERRLVAATRARAVADEERDVSERRWKTTFEYLPMPAALVDGDGVYLDWNRAAERLFGYRRDEIVGRQFAEIGHIQPDSVARAGETWARVVGQERAGPLELVFRCKDGESRVVENWGFALARDGSTEVVLVGVDVTERNALAEALAAREERFRRVFEDGPIGIVVASPDLRIVMANGKAAELLGHAMSALTGTELRRIIHPDDVAKWDGLVRSVLRAEPSTARVEVRCIRRGGTILHAGLTITAIRRNDESVANVLVMLQDASERWQAELQRDRIFGIALEMMGITDLEGHILAFNPHLGRTFGYDLHEMKGLSFLDFVHDADIDRCREAAEMLSRGQAVSDVEARIRREDGTYRWTSWNAVSVVEENVVYWTARDMTDKKVVDAELSQHRDEVAHALRVLTLGEMASQVCHEVNQPLGAIVNYASGLENLLLLRGVGDDEMLRVVRRIAEQGQRAGDLVNSIRGFVRSTASRREPSELNEIVRQSVRLLRVDAREDVEFRMRLADELPQVLADATQIEQVIVNVLENAIDAARRNAERRNPVVSIRTARAGDDGVELEVLDSGRGVPADQLSRIFDAFFTTKENGLGLGLAISRKLVDAHKGRIVLFNSPDGGVLARIVLPAISSRAKPA